MTSTGLTGYLAPEGHLEDLLAEFGGVAEVHGRLVLAEGPARPAAWTANIWRNPERLAITSIADGAAQLRARQRSWALYPHRRSHAPPRKLPLRRNRIGRTRTTLSGFMEIANVPWSSNTKWAAAAFSGLRNPDPLRMRA